MAMRPMSDSEVQDHYEAVAEVLARQVERGRAPWMRSFDGTETPLPIGMRTREWVRNDTCVWLTAVALERGWRDPH